MPFLICFIMETPKNLHDRYIGNPDGGAIDSGFTASPDVNTFIPGQSRSVDSNDRVNLPDFNKVVDIATGNDNNSPDLNKVVDIATGNDNNSPDLNESNKSDSNSSPGTDHYSGYDAVAQRIRDVLGNTVIDNLMLGWQPDSNLSTEENLSSLRSWLDSLFLLYSFQPWKGSSLNFADQPFNYASILQMVYKSLSNTGPLIDISDAATLEIAEKVADMSYNYINEQFSAALSYQSWYLQQDYNSPINQINRLAEAGLSNAFVFSGLSSGNASNAAQMPLMHQPSASNAGQAQVASESNSSSLLGSIFGTAASFIPGLLSAGGSFFKDVIEGETAKALRPLQIAELGSKIVGSAAVFDRQRTEMEQIGQNMAMQVMDKEISFGSEMVSKASQSVDSALASYQTDWNNYSQEYTETAYQVNVVDKSGNTKSYTMSQQELEDCINNNGKTVDGSTVVGSESWEKAFSASMNVGTKVGLPLVGSAEASGSFGASDKNSGSSSNSASKSVENGFSVNTKNGSVNIGYSEDGKTFHIGDTTFKSVTTRKRIPLPEYRDQIKRKYLQYQNALDHYNTLSSGQQARCLRLLDELTENLSKFSAGVVSAQYSSRIKDLFKPKEIVGD